MKEGYGPPTRYLGANIDRIQLEYVRIVWSETCVDYLRGSIDNVDRMLKEYNTALKCYGDGHRPYPSSYRPELYVSQELGPELINRYQQLIGTLRWDIELGSIDIMTEISCLSQYLCYPR